MYKLVGEHFLEKPSAEHTHLIHKDYSRDNDTIYNLKWVTKAEFREHYKKSPKVKKGIVEGLRKKRINSGCKISTTEMIRLKRMLQNPKGETRKYIIARQFNISTTRLNRIIRGENWGHLTV